MDADYIPSNNLLSRIMLILPHALLCVYRAEFMCNGRISIENQALVSEGWPSY